MNIRLRVPFKDRLVPLLLIASSIACIPLVALDLGYPIHLRGLLLVVCGGCLVGGLSWSPVRDPKDDGPGPPVPSPLTRTEIEDAEAEMLERYSADSISYFGRLLMSLHEYLVRVDESAELLGQYIEISNHLVFRVPTDITGQSAGNSPHLVIPVAVCKRGVLLDRFEVRDAQGQRLCTLSQRDACGLAVQTVKSVFNLAHATTSARAAETGDTVPSPDANDFSIMWNLIENVACHGRKVSEAQDEINAELDHVLTLSSAFNAEGKNTIRRVCRVLSETYMIVAEVPNSGANSVSVSYSHQRPIEKPTYSTYERFRARLGLSPYSADIELTRVLQAGSYHFQMSAPSGQYVFSHRLALLGSKDEIRQTAFQIAGRQQYLRMGYRTPRPIAHIYARKVGNEPPDKELALKTIVYFREVPPGASGLAAVLLTITGLLTLMIAATGVGVAGQDPGGNADVTAFLLAAPAFASAAFGHWIGENNLIRSSLTSALALALATVLSIASAVIYVWDSSRSHEVKTLPDSAFGGLVQFQSGGPLWISISTVTFIAAFYVAYIVYYEVRFYVKRGSTSGGSPSHGSN